MTSILVGVLGSPKIKKDVKSDDLDILLLFVREFIQKSINNKADTG